ncbi:hypothetical protein N9J72_00830 [Candidatus Gracilibacteria bacterium]|nr:hypothetical protein [Candidatus Gracilibacteria bacterium]
MKKIILLLSISLLFVSCAQNTNTQTQNSTGEVAQNTANITNCEADAQAAETKLEASNENPDVSLEFLGSAEVNNTCFLKVKITQQVGVETAEVFTLFDTETEQSYDNYVDEQQMELAIIEMTQ